MYMTLGYFLLLISSVCNSNENQCSQEKTTCGCQTNREQSLNPITEEIDKAAKYVKENNVDPSRPQEYNHDANPFILIPGGTFTMGTDEPIFPADGEAPARSKKVSSFYLQTHEVTNEEFEIFVKVSGYVTEVSICKNEKVRTL